MNTRIERFEFKSGILLRKVEDPPGPIDLADTLKDSSLMFGVGRHSLAFTHEVVINCEILGHSSVSLAAACVIAGIRIRGPSDMLVPAIADQSWSTILARDSKSVNAQLYEDVPKAYQFEPEKELSGADFDWVKNNFGNLEYLLKNSKSFLISVDSLIQHNKSPSPSIAIATLWTGIEAIFPDVGAELSFRISIYVASLLENRGEKRLEKYRQVKRLYDIRSKIVHGADIGDEVISPAILEVRVLLASLLCIIVERGNSFTLNELNKALLT